MRKSKLAVFGLLGVLVFSGCSLIKTMMGKGEKKSIPRILVLGVKCAANQEIGDQIADGILANMTPKVESFSAFGYELLISSITRKKAGLPPPSGTYIPPYDEKTKPAIEFSSSTFYKDLTKSQYYRTKVILETGLDYVVTGEAKEQNLSELEVGNLVTAESAQIKLMELRTGEFVVEDTFKQGLFEIVAPDRIGIKLAGKINKYFSSVRKAEKKEAKELLKRFEE